MPIAQVAQGFYGILPDRSSSPRGAASNTSNLLEPSAKSQKDVDPRREPHLARSWSSSKVHLQSLPAASVQYSLAINQLSRAA